MGERHCTHCFVIHGLPTGRRCPHFLMTTNVIQSPITTIEGQGLDTVTMTTSSGTAQATASTSQSSPGGRQDDVILAELRKLASRLANVEHEMQSQSRTSTPKRKRKKRAGRPSTNLAASSLHDTQSTLDESLFSLHGSVQTLPLTSVTTTMSTAGSLFTQGTAVTTVSTSPVVISRAMPPTTMYNSVVIYQTIDQVDLLCLCLLLA